MAESTVTQRGNEQADAQFNTDRTYPDRWTITFSNPPINMFVPSTIVELATHGPIGDSRPMAFLDCPRGHRVDPETRVFEARA